MKSETVYDLQVGVVPCGNLIVVLGGSGELIDSVKVEIGIGAGHVHGVEGTVCGSVAPAAVGADL